MTTIGGAVGGRLHAPGDQAADGAELPRLGE